MCALQVLTVIALEATDNRVIFNALDVIVLFVKFDCVPDVRLLPSLDLPLPFLVF